MSIIKATYEDLSGQILAKNVADILSKKYPDHPWWVKVDQNGGIVAIFHLMLSAQFGYVLKINDLKSDTEYRTVVEAGGTILEAMGLARGKKDVEAMRGLSREFTGAIAFDKGALAAPLDRN